MICSIVDRLDRPVRRYAVASYQGLTTECTHALCPHGGRVKGVQLIGGAAQYTAGVEQLVARLAQQHLALWMR